MIPGEVITADGNILLNEGRSELEINVSNSGDRPIQVGSHYHFLKRTKHYYSTETRPRACD